MENNRALFARSFCIGNGIEIGALHHPLRLPPGSRARYVDRMTRAQLYEQYAELRNENLVQVDIVDDGETLATLPDGGEDFLIACQFIEHCQHPVRALVNMLRVVKDGGFVLLTVPDKWQTFDKDRQITSNQHLLDECLHGCESTARDHYREYARTVDGRTDPGEIEEVVDYYQRTGISIHWHIWDPEAFLGFLMFFKDRFKLPFRIFATLLNGNELMVALQKRLG
ncbi:MAG: methyltransferase domain-containing protein [Fibrobacteres bacterium]|nr:methyltransferase domain-containing protein [Fibrobacterota bacterium]